MTHISWSSDFALYLEDYLGHVKRICVFEHSVMTNFNCTCPVIQRGQGSSFLSKGSSWLTACMSGQRRFWRDCAWRGPFDVCTSYFGCMNQYDQTFDLKINVGHCDLYSMVQWFCLIAWRLFDAQTLLFGIMSQYDPKFDLKINIGHCDLYFMVQWFCVTSWRLFDEWQHHTLRLRVSMTWHFT